jgi:hypothetical protein
MANGLRSTPASKMTKVGTTLKLRQNRETPELGLDVSRLKNAD